VEATKAANAEIYGNADVIKQHTQADPVPVEDAQPIYGNAEVLNQHSAAAYVLHRTVHGFNRIQFVLHREPAAAATDEVYENKDIVAVHTEHAVVEPDGSKVMSLPVFPLFLCLDCVVQVADSHFNYNPFGEPLYMNLRMSTCVLLIP
jgi:hypothetical protein